MGFYPADVFHGGNGLKRSDDLAQRFARWGNPLWLPAFILGAAFILGTHEGCPYDFILGTHEGCPNDFQYGVEMVGHHDVCVQSGVGESLGDFQPFGFHHLPGVVQYQLALVDAPE